MTPLDIDSGSNSSSNSMMWSYIVFNRIPLLSGVLFYCGVSSFCISNIQMFMKRHGRRHATCGFFYLLLLVVGQYALAVDGTLDDIEWFFYDALLGLLGIVLTLAAAFDFQHKNVVNVASGTLDEHATVTFGEMIEHSFYQGLNFIQIMYFHFVKVETPFVVRILAAFAVTTPWLLRDAFPVNRFSDNYTKTDEKSTTLIRLLYRIKKYQYVFYKHFLLHGLNISVAVYGYEIACNWYFRLYWSLICTSYVMEFFLQTLVKKGYMLQSTMLVLQKLLMMASTIAAVHVLLLYVNPWVSMLSLVLNFLHRKHDMTNVSCIMFLVIGLLYWS